MAWDQIGSREFLQLEGAIHRPAVESEVIGNRNVDGHLLRKGGTKGKVSSLRTIVDVASLSNADAEHDACVALVGTVVTVTRVFPGGSYTRTDVYVSDYTPGEIQYQPTASGGVNGGQYLVHGAWSVMDTST